MISGSVVTKLQTRIYQTIRKAMYSNPRLHDYGWQSMLKIHRLIEATGFSEFFTNFTMVGMANFGKIILRPFLFNGILMALQAYEPFVKEVFKPKSGETVVDVGSYIGFYTLLSSKSVGPFGKVISLEPNPTTFSLLLRTLHENYVSNVIPLNCAAGSDDGVARFEMQSQYPASSRIVRNSFATSSNQQVTNVQLRSLDSLLRELSIDRVDWIKIDSEEMELDVLKGCKETLRRSNPRIVLEGSKEAVDYLVGLGYTVEQLSGASSYFFCYPAILGSSSERIIQREEHRKN